MITVYYRPIQPSDNTQETDGDEHKIRWMTMLDFFTCNSTDFYKYNSLTVSVFSYNNVQTFQRFHWKAICSKNLIKLDSYLEATYQFNLKDVMINLFLIKDILISYKENYMCYYVI